MILPEQDLTPEPNHKTDTTPQHLAAACNTLDQITDTWNIRQQASSVTGTSMEDNKELNKQLGQMSAGGTSAASDANIINDRMPMLTPYVVREYMQDKGTPYYKQLFHIYTLSTINRDG